MTKRADVFLVFLAALSAFALRAGSPATPAATASVSSNPPLVLITLENTEFKQVYASPYANYLNCAGPYLGTGFTCQGTVFSNYYSVQHHSLPNYLDLTSGGDNGCLSDNCASTPGFSETSLFGQIGAAGLSFNSLEESMPSNCDRVNSGVYVARHNPEVYSADVAATSVPYNCGATDVKVADLFPSVDAWPNPLPSFSLITPNLCDDAHGHSTCISSTGPAEDCTSPSVPLVSVCNADNWLAVNVPALLSETPQPTVVITFDEGTTPSCGDGAHACGGRVMTAVVGPGVTARVVDPSGPYSHFSLLRGVEDYFGLPCQQEACAAVPILIPQAPESNGGILTTPGQIFSTAASPGTVGLTWAVSVDSDNEPVAGYEVQRTDANGNLVFMGPGGTTTPSPVNGGLAPIATGTNSYTDPSVAPGAIYAYVVTAVDPHGNVSSPTSPLSVPVPSTYNCGSTSGVPNLQQCAGGRGINATATVTLSGQNVKAGDFLLAVIGSRGLSTTTFCVAVNSAPTAWKPVASSPSICASPEFNTTMYDVVNAAARTCPCTVTFKLSAVEDWTMWVGDYASVAASSPLDRFARSDSGSLPASTMSTGTTGATTKPGDLAVAILWNDSSLPGLGPVATGTDVGAWTAVDVAVQGGGGWMEILQKVITGSGASAGAQDLLTSGAAVRGVVAAFKTG